MATNFTEKTVSYVRTESGNYSIRSLHAHATKEEWEQPPLNSYIPEEGEIVVYDRASEDGRDLTKIGDGKTPVNELQFSGSQVSSVNGKSGIVELSAQDVGARPDTWTPTASQVGAVPTSRKVNNKALSSDISLSASDVGAAPSSHVADKNNPHGVTAEQAGAPDAPRTVSGEVVSMNDSGNLPLRGLKLYGKTVQNGTPTPSAPIPLESVGASGSIGVTVAGKNLIPSDVLNASAYTEGGYGDEYPTVYKLPMIEAGNTYTLSFDWVKRDTYYFLQRYDSNSGEINAVNYLITPSINSGKVKSTFTAENGNEYYLYGNNQTFLERALENISNFQLELGSTATAYEPYKGQTLTASTQGGLPGIPVASGGNYTDENGQAWVCDEVDFARGVYVQRTNVWTADENAQFVQHMLTNQDYFVCVANSSKLGANRDGFCNLLPVAKDAGEGLQTSACLLIGTASTPLHFSVPTSIANSVSSFKKWAIDNSLCVVYTAKEPIETPLSAVELAQYAALHSNKPNTTIYNDGVVEMEVSYYTPNAAVPMNVGSGASGKVLSVDEHGCVTAKTLKQIGAAPAEYGLGDANNAQVITDWGALNAAVQPGWYKITFDTWYTGECIMRVDAMDNQVVQTFMQSNGELKIGRRVKVVNNDWGELEDYSASAFAPAVHTHTAADVGARPNTWMPTAGDVGARPNTWTPTASDVGAVPTSRKINGHALREDINLTASDVGARDNTWTPTATDVGARPNTWMPTAEEVGARPNTWLPTIADIGAVPTTRIINNQILDKDINLTAADVGARDNNWLPTAEEIGAKDINWMPTIGEIGAAPSGYGLGGSAKMLTSADDLNNIKENGWYSWEWGNPPANAPRATYGEAYYMNALRVWTANGNICCQETMDVSDSSTRGMRIVRTIYGGQAFPWEWEIPPMTVGNEYRTTERWQKKAVYTKLINLGALPARNSNIHVSTDVSATAIIRATAQISDGSSMPYGYNQEIISFSASTTTINVYTADNEYAEYADKTGTAQIWYTKD